MYSYMYNSMLYGTYSAPGMEMDCTVIYTVVGLLYNCGNHKALVVQFQHKQAIFDSSERMRKNQ